MVEQLKIGVDKYFKKKVLPFIDLKIFWQKANHLLTWINQRSFQILENQKILSKHYGDNYGLGIAKSIYDVVLEKTKNIVKNSKFLVICWWFFNYWPSILDICACVCCERMEKDVDSINFGALGKVRANSFFKVIFYALLKFRGMT